MILVVDDEPISLRVITYFLKQTAYHFLALSDSYEAWQLLQSTPKKFSLIIADRVMPRLNGVQLLEKMRETEGLKDTPLILLTSTADRTEVIEATKAGATDFLYKPIHKDLLFAVIKRMLKYRDNSSA